MLSMALLDKLKSLLGMDEGRSGGDRRQDDEVGVTVEHDSGAGSRPSSDSDEPPIASTAEQTDPAPGEADAERVDADAAADPEEAPPGTDAPGTETAEPAPAETGDAAEEGAGVDGTVDVEPDVDSPEPEEEAESEPDPSVDAEGTETEPASDAEDEAGSEAGSPDPATSDVGTTDETLQDLKGIGPSYETSLSEAGVETVDDLAAADADELSEETGLSSKRLQRWIDRASHR